MRLIQKDRFDSSIILYEIGGGEELILTDSYFPSVDGMATVENDPKGKILIFSANCFVILKNYNPRFKTAKALFYIRENKFDHGSEQPHIGHALKYPKLVAALIREKTKPIRVPGKFDSVVLFRSELAIVNDQGGQVTEGWLIKYEEKERLLNNLPKIEDSGVSGFLWIMYEDKKVYILYRDPNKTSCYARKVEYDTGSFKVKSITNPDNSKQKSALACRKPKRFLFVNEAIPHAFRPKSDTRN
jgi:hypothetical protein